MPCLPLLPKLMEVYSFSLLLSFLKKKRSGKSNEIDAPDLLFLSFRFHQSHIFLSKQNGHLTV